MDKLIIKFFPDHVSCSLQWREVMSGDGGPPEAAGRILISSAPGPVTSPRNARRVLTELAERYGAARLMGADPADWPRQSDAFWLRTAGRKAGIDLEFVGVPTDAEIRKARQDDRVRMLEEDLEARGWQLEFHPAIESVGPQQSSHSFSYPRRKKATVYLRRPRDVSSTLEESAAHELMHMVLSDEGWGCPELGGEVSVEELEVVRRLDELGFSSLERARRHIAHIRAGGRISLYETWFTALALLLTPEERPAFLAHSSRFGFVVPAAVAGMPGPEHRWTATEAVEADRALARGRREMARPVAGKADIAVQSTKQLRGETVVSFGPLRIEKRRYQ